jgi:hypothetical protein
VQRILLMTTALLGLIAVRCSVASSQDAQKVSELPDRPSPRVETHLSRDWLILSVVGQAAALADAGATLSLRHEYPNFIEHDPLARPFVTLPGPAYVALAMALTAGISIGSLKLQKSPNRFVRRLWWVPQTVQIGTNGPSAARSAGSWGWPSYVSPEERRRRIIR